jgi:hypothetical protein
MRGRNRNNKGPNPLTRSYESNGPDVKIRGTAQHIAEKYSQLSRDAQASGDPVAAENYLQHAEHYFRIIAAAQEQLREQYGYQERPDDGDEDGFEGNRPYGSGEEGDFGSQPQPYDGSARFERPERQDRQGQDRQGQDRQGQDRQGQDRQQDRPERQDRQPDRRERFQRDRPPRQDFQRDDRVDRPERQDRQPERPEREPRPERPERGEFRRERRRPAEETEGDAGGLPAFLTNPVRQPIAIGEEGEAPEANGMNGGLNGEGDYRTRRRRRRTRFGAEEGEPEGGDAPQAGTNATEPPATE